MKEITGNLVTMLKNAEFDIGIHGCNCFHKMKSGIAKEMVAAFPAAEKADRYTSIYANEEKLGNFTCIKVYNGVTIINAYTQFTYSRDKRVADYTAIRKVFTRIKHIFGNKSLSFGIPKIGAGLAGGDWAIISKIIDEEMEGEDITLVNYG